MWLGVRDGFTGRVEASEERGLRLEAIVTRNLSAGDGRASPVRRDPSNRG